MGSGSTRASHNVSDALQKLHLNRPTTGGLRPKSSPPPPQAPDHFDLFNLPVELRDKVYDQILVDGGELSSDGLTVSFKPSTFDMSVKNFIRACPWERTALLRRFYIKRNNFCRLHFESLEEARCFLVDDYWCPQDVRDDVKGEVKLIVPAVDERTMDDVTVQLLRKICTFTPEHHKAQSSPLSNPLPMPRIEDLISLFEIIPDSDEGEGSVEPKFELKCHGRYNTIKITGKDWRVHARLDICACKTGEAGRFRGSIGRIGMFRKDVGQLLRESQDFWEESFDF